MKLSKNVSFDIYCLEKIKTGWYAIDPVGLTLCSSEIEKFARYLSLVQPHPPKAR